VKQRPFNVLAGVSLLLLIATAVLFIRTFIANDFCELSLPGATHGMVLYKWEFDTTSARGVVEVMVTHAWETAKGQQDLDDQREIFQGSTSWSHDAEYPHDVEPSRHQLFNFAFDIIKSSPDGLNADRGILLRIPLWFLLVILSIVPARWIQRRVRAKQQASSTMCQSCGYDLRATPGRCPECGAVPS
jgi:hypothetical protein